ncbi:MAG: hypothetical protein ACOX2A_11650 [Tepidanaerobacteraceae bacterium]|nr:hypothetical protein [Thermoanaerobacterales bacterium]
MKVAPVKMMALLPKARPVILKLGPTLRRGSRAIRRPAECPSACVLHAAPASFVPSLRITTVLLNGILCHHLNLRTVLTDEINITLILQFGYISDIPS